MASRKYDEPAQNNQQAQADPQQTVDVSIQLDGKQVAQAQTVEHKLDYAPLGGRYIVNGQLVDANGQPVKDK